MQARGCDWADLGVHVVAVCVAKAGMHSRGAHRHSRAEAGYKAQFVASLLSRTQGSARKGGRRLPPAVTCAQGPGAEGGEAAAPAVTCAPCRLRGASTSRPR